MTQEDKDLLLIDLCARIPYKPIVQIDDCGIWDLRGIDHADSAELSDSVIVWHRENYSSINSFPIIKCKPYLFPLSSMSEEQKRDLTSLFKCCIIIKQYEIDFPNYEDSNMDNWMKVRTWCYKNHFDINGLLPKGLANDATGKNVY